MVFFLLSVALSGQVGREGLLQLDASGVLPSIEKFGMIEDPLLPSHPAVTVAYQAFRDVYGPLWFERYVQPESRFAMNKIHHAALAKILPAKVAAAIAIPAESYVLVPVSVYSPELGNVVLQLIITKDTSHGWKISSITVP
jgi:hypothetical protein